MKLSDYVFQFVADTGVRHVFMLSGGGAMHLVDSAGNTPGLEFIASLHEQGASVAAEAYGQYTNNLGVALVTTGPGGTNAITGVAGAWLDSTPMLVISGQVKRADMIGERGCRQMGFQELDSVALVNSITKYAATVMEPSSIRFHLEKALHLACSGRPGPVWLEIPLDVQAAQIDVDSLEGFTPELEQGSAAERDNLAGLVHRAIELLNRSERPIVLVGNGVRLAGAQERLLRLLEHLRLPILTTWKEIDFLPEDHPLFVGRPGAIGQRGANFAQQNSDWILTVGARLDFGQTGYMHRWFARGARKVIVDVDVAEICKLDMDVDVPVIADAADFVDEFAAQVEAGRIVELERTEWLRRCKKWQARYPVVLPEYWDQSRHVNTYVLIDVLSDELSGDDLVVPGSSGSCSEVTMQALRVKPGMRVLNTEGLGSMGFGVPAAIGACLAADHRRTICIEGDGSLNMNAQELEVVKRLNLPIKIFVLNNSGYASIRASQSTHFGRLVAADETSGLTLPDAIRIADAYGIPGVRLESHAGIRTKVREVLDSDGPILCEVVVSPEQPTQPKLSSYQRADGSMASKPLEDLWPFLHRAEFLGNMIVPQIDED